MISESQTVVRSGRKRTGTKRKKMAEDSCVTLTSTDGTKLNVRVFPFPEETKAVIAIIHGYADHSARYTSTAKRFAEEGFGSIAIDYRGHGKSEGARGACVYFKEFLNDIDVFLKFCAEKAEGKPLFLLGHSHGGLILLRRLLNGPLGVKVAGAIASSPFLGLGLPISPIVLNVGRAISNIITSFTLPNDIKPEYISHDPEEIKAYTSDPFVFKTANARWFSEALIAQEYVKTHAAELSSSRNAIPLLIIQAGDDKIVSVEATRYVALMGGDKVRYIELPGMYHEILNEIDRSRAFNEIFFALNQWLNI